MMKKKIEKGCEKEEKITGRRIIQVVDTLTGKYR